MYHLLAVAVFLWFSVAAPLSAQSCLGSPSGSRMNVRLGISTPDGSTQLSARAGVLVKRIFGGVSGEYAKVSLFDGSVNTGGADVGVAIPINSAKSFFLCPTVGASVTRIRLQYRAFFPGFDELGLNERVTTRQVAVALNLGGAVDISPTVDLVPFASLGVLLQRSDNASTNPTSPFAPSVDPSPNNASGVLGLGLGLQFNRRFAITASLMQRAVSGGGDSMITVSGAIGFGPR